MPKTNVVHGYSVERVQAAIRHHKAANGLNWAQLGRAVGINGSVLNDIARGKRKPSRCALRAFGFVRLQEMTSAEIRAAFENRVRM